MEAQDESMMDQDEPRDEVDARLPLSEDEQRVLDLYDQLQQLRLEIAIINAQTSYQPGVLNPNLFSVYHGKNRTQKKKEKSTKIQKKKEPPH
jgi:hypothetical protein